ncbi:MAG: hypothetical protein FWE90_06015 [Defluviitaleaceae bacterium]|nr:hypothetical protein [Defluviitaleaceae bacterium]
MRLILGIVILTAGLILLQLVNGDLNVSLIVDNFIDGPSLIIIAVAITGTIVIYGKGNTFRTGIKIAFNQKGDISKPEIENALNLFTLLKKNVLCAGVLSFLITLIPFMSHYGRSNLYGINQSLYNEVSMFFIVLPVSLVGVYYSFLVIFILINPVIAILKRHLIEKADLS